MAKESTLGNRGHPCIGLAAIFVGMLYNVQIIQESRTRNIMHISIIVLELPAKLQWVRLNGLNGEYYGNDLFCLRSRTSIKSGYSLWNKMKDHSYVKRTMKVIPCVFWSPHFQVLEHGWWCPIRSYYCHQDWTEKLWMLIFWLWHLLALCLLVCSHQLLLHFLPGMINKSWTGFTSSTCHGDKVVCMQVWISCIDMEHHQCWLVSLT